MWSTCVFCVGFFFILQTQSGETSETKVRMCYYGSWARYRRTAVGYFTPYNIDPKLCTHVIYAFAAIDTDNTNLVWDQDTNLGFSWLYDMKMKHPFLKTLLAIGGADSVQTRRFQVMSNSSSLKTVFIAGLMSTLRTFDFDGVAIDWSFPTSKTKKLHAQLLKDLQTTFAEEARVSGRERLMLTTAVSGMGEKVVEDYEPALIADAVDYIMLTTYDLWSLRDLSLGHHTQLFVRPTYFYDMQPRRFSLNKTIEAWSRLVRPEKLVLGVASYGRTTLLFHPAVHSMGYPYTRRAGTPGNSTRTSGFLAYYEICQNLNSSTWVSLYDYYIEGAFAYSTVPPYDWVCYDIPRSVRVKAMLALSRGLGGIYLWTVDYDDFTGLGCGTGPYPLLRAIRDVFQSYVPPSTTTSTTPPSTTTTTPTTTTPTTTTTPSTTTRTTTTTSTTITPTTTTTLTTSSTTTTPTTTISTTSSTTITPSATTTTPSTTTTTPSTTITPTTTTTTTTTTIPTTTTTHVPLKCERFSCPGVIPPTNPNHIFPDDFDCTSYYQCVAPGLPIKYHMHCPGKQRFDHTNNQCDHPKNVPCLQCPNEDR